jgi:hypothetical protein
MDRIPASERTRERLKSLMEGHGEKADFRSELVRLAARLIVEKAWRAKPRTSWDGSIMCVVHRRLSQWLPHGPTADRHS